MCKKRQSQIPVFFVHSGNQKYLSYTVKQAEKTNESVFLLGDNSNKAICKNWVCMDDYIAKDWENFSKTYKHMSTNPYLFELNCFRRFFVSYQFAKKKGISEFMMLDSDCLAYSDFSELDFSAYDAGMSIPKKQENYTWTASPHASYWTIPALEDFLKYLIYEYTENLKELEEKWNYHQIHNIRGGICDMTLLYLWSISGRGFRILNTTLRLEEGTFDHFLSVTEGYQEGEFPVRKFCEIKKVKFIQEKAYFKNKSGSWIHTYTIHAQGKSKIYIKTLSEQRNGYIYYVIVKMENVFGKILRKMKVIK